ncbi:MAG: hypothetical protein ACLFNQ_09780 [Spirochaetaceae bacterium]
MHIDQFVARHRESISIRGELVRDALEGRLSETAATGLSQILADINAAVDHSGNLHLEIAGRSVATRADYERTELARDIVLAEQGFDAVIHHITEQDPCVYAQAVEVAQQLSGRSFIACFTDRDGTVNGYSNRYVSSIQPAYIAVALTRFAASVCEHFVILTAGPLEKPGVLDLSVMPSNTAVYAASKGRQVVLPDGSRASAYLSPERRRALELLASAISGLYESAEFAPFRYVGSGLQTKFGECSVAYQDWQSNCPDSVSQTFRTAVKALIRRLDPTLSTFHIEDGGRELDISTLGSGSASFDKGSGLRLVVEQAGMRLDGRSVLVCGDTMGDLPMVERVVESGARLVTVFVTTNDSLKQRVHDLDAEALFVDRYESLVLGMYLAVMEETHEYMVV